MKFTLMLVLAATPITDKVPCHHYTRWFLPTHQTCSADGFRPMTDDELRAAAMPALRAELDRLVNSEQRE